MTDEVHDILRGWDADALEEETSDRPEKRWERLRQVLGWLGRLIGRLWGRVRQAFGWLGRLIGRLWGRIALTVRWLIRPDEVGQSIALQPRGVRTLVLLILGNLAVIALLTIGLYHAAGIPAAEGPQRLVVATATPGPPPTAGPSPTPLGSGGAIAFTLRRNGNGDIYALNQAGRQLAQLTNDPAEDRDPAWSPDGSQIAFASNRADNWDIYLLDLATGRLIRQTRDAAFDGNPSWSPDGDQIAFESYRSGNLDIYIMGITAVSDKVQRITTSSAPEYEPTWSPDGRAIAFTSLRDGSKDIYLYLIEERRTVNVTNSPSVDEDNPAWSPDGTQLAYVSGPRGNPSIQVTTFDWDTMAVDQAQTELFGTGASPTWAPDGEVLVYTYERGGLSYLTAASLTGWGRFHEVYSTEGLVDDLAWTNLALSPRVIARAGVREPAANSPVYVEVVQATPAVGPPYRLLPLANVEGDGEPYLSDRVNESFSALRQRMVAETGWDYLGTLSSSWLSMTYTPPNGHSRLSWHLCGRAIGLDQAPYEGDEPQIELAREDAGNITYWRVFVRTTEQDGSMGEPLRDAVWDLNARQEGGRAMVEGGASRERVPSGYYVDFTTLAGDHGWERIPSLGRWRYSWPDIRWWELQKTDGLTWWECMLEMFELEEIETQFGPIPE